MTALLLDMADYWPNPKPSERQITQETFKRGEYSRCGEAVCFDEFEPDGWLCTWEYRFDGPDVVEFADKERHGIYKVFKPGKELGWGGAMSVGDTAKGKVEIDVLKSRLVPPFFGVKGFWSTKLEAVHAQFTNPAGLAFKNVVQIFNSQTFYNFMDWKIFGSRTWQRRSWLASGVGAVQTDYINVKTGEISRHYAKSIKTAP